MLFWTHSSAFRWSSIPQFPVEFAGSRDRSFSEPLFFFMSRSMPSANAEGPAPDLLKVTWTDLSDATLRSVSISPSASSASPPKKKEEKEEEEEKERKSCWLAEALVWSTGTSIPAQ